MYSDQDFHPVFQTKLVSSWLLPTIRKNLFSRSPNILTFEIKFACLRRGPSVSVDFMQDLCCQTPREVEEFLISIDCHSQASPFPRTKGGNTKQNHRQIFVSELPDVKGLKGRIYTTALPGQAQIRHMKDPCTSVSLPAIIHRWKSC